MGLQMYLLVRMIEISMFYLFYLRYSYLWHPVQGLLRGNFSPTNCTKDVDLFCWTNFLKGSSECTLELILAWAFVFVRLSDIMILYLTYSRSITSFFIHNEREFIKRYLKCFPNYQILSSVFILDWSHIHFLTNYIE